VELIGEIIVTKEIMLEDFRKQRNSCGMCIHALHHWWRMSSRAIIGSTFTLLPPCVYDVTNKDLKIRRYTQQVLVSFFFFLTGRSVFSSPFLALLMAFATING
jgi:hypothetical protein